MVERSIAVRLKAEIGQFRTALAEAARLAEGLGDKAKVSSDKTRVAMGSMAQSARTNREAWERTGTALLAVGAAAGAGVGIAVKSFAEFERAMSAAEAATQATGAELKSLKDAAIDAGASTQYSATEAAEAITAMGKAGVSTGDILGGGLQGALDLAAAGQLEVGQAAEMAATALTQFGMAGEDIPHVADLLAAGAGKAQGEVTDLANALKYVGPVAAGMNVSIEETTGVLAAFASQGIIGEQAGTGLRGMLSSLTSPSKQAAAEIGSLGITLYDAQGSFLGLENAAGELQRAYGPMTDAQRDASLGVLFGNEQVTAARVLYRQGAEGVAEWTAAVDDSGFAAEQAAALTNNLTGDLERLGGALSTALISAGEQGSGALRGVTQDLTSLVDLFNDAPSGVQSTVTALGAVTAATGLTGGAALIAVPQLVEFYDGLGKLGKAGGAAQTGLRGIGTFLLGPWGLALGAGALVLGAFVNHQIDARQRVDELADSLDAQTGAVTDSTRAAVVRRLQDEGVLDTARRLGVGLDTVTDAALGSAGAQRELARAQEAAEARDLVTFQDVLATSMDELGGKTLTLQGNLDRMSVGARNTGAAFGDLRAKLTDYAEQTGTAQERIRQQAEAMGENTAATDTAAAAAAGLAAGTAGLAGAVDATAASLGISKEAMEEWSNSAVKAVEEFVDPLGTYRELLAQKEEAERVTAQATADSTDSGEDSWEDYVGNVSVSLSDYAAKLEEQVANQQRWQENLVTVAQRAGLGVAQELQSMGAEGVDLVAAMANGTDAEVQRMAAALIAESSAGGQGAVQALNTQMAVMAEVAAAGGQKTADELATKLGLGVAEVAGIAAQYGVELASGINPVLSALGKRPINVNQQAGRGYTGLTEYANGGIEDHVAQIAPGGAYRLWAEDETGGEAYIPLSPAKRGRSTDIWREVGQRLGVRFEEFAQGGFSSAGQIPKPSSTAPYRQPISTAGDSAMEKAYAEASAWLSGNLEREGTSGSGVLGATGPMAGSLVDFGRRLQAMGARVSEHPAFGGVEPVHSKNSAHYSGRAIDVNTRPGTSALEQRELAPMRDLARASGFKTIFMDPKLGHNDHLHIAMKQGGILNPHVRDTGGPLLPGFTFNGTGAPETVLPNRVFGVNSPAMAGTTVIEEHTHYHLDSAVAARTATGYVEAASTVKRREQSVLARRG